MSHHNFEKVCCMFFIDEVGNTTRTKQLHVAETVSCLRSRFGADNITKTCLYNFDLLKPHFCKVNLGLI